MCGIVGIASAVPVAAPEELVTMRDALRHRGPDEEGLWWSEDRRVGLGHRRLSILDLTATGRQPMADASGQVHISYNGELYNHTELRRELAARGHRFRGTSDTEVLLAAYREWGTGCLARFNGMFAFALHDGERGRVFVARDRVGEKPLFYRHAGAAFSCASELSALLAVTDSPRRLDLDALDHYLAYGYVPGDRCILKGVKKLAPAHALVYEPQRERLRVWRYWSLPEPAPAPGAAPSGAIESALSEELEALLADSVRLRLAADVPVGLLLSGGLDSGLVAALAVRSSSSRVRTFTVSFPGHPDHDEGPLARHVASYLGTDHTEIPAEPATLDLLSELAGRLDEPMADSSLIPTHLVSRAIRPHAKVALGGDGGDELFGGYPHYGWLARAERLRGLLPRPLRRLVGATAQALPVGLRGRNHLLGFTGDRSWSIAHVNLYFDARTRRRLVTSSPEEPGVSPETWRGSLGGGHASLLQQATRADFRSTLADAYLVKVDRASMLTSLEVRCPWLDHRLVEFALGRVPDALRAGPRGQKVLPRQLAARLLPPGHGLAPKRGLTMPLDNWLQRDGAGGLAVVLREADPALFDRRVVDELLSLQQRGYRNAQRLYSLALFELWRREHHIEGP